MKKICNFRVLGQVSLLCGTSPLALPASKKTRALLAYLAVTGRPHSRERLCEIFWDTPDDPRGALRWSLSKLRKAMSACGDETITANRDDIEIKPDAISLDLNIVKGTLSKGVTTLPLETLRETARKLEPVFLDGLDMPNQAVFQSWLSAQRDEIAALKIKVFKTLAQHSKFEDGERVSWARQWLAADPLSEEAAIIVTQGLRQLGRAAEAKMITKQFQALAKEAGVILSETFNKALGAGAAPEPIDDMAQTQKPAIKQIIQFCETPDNIRIAYAKVGSGPPLIKAANWLNHLELDWDSPIWGDTFRRCAAQRTFIRYDERGNGLSDWDVAEISQEKFVQDLEAVVDHLEVEKFPLLGISQGCAVSIEYAVRHPERVSGLILISGYASGWRIGASAEEQERREAVMTLTRLGWGTNNPAYRQIFAQTFMPDAPAKDLEWFNEFQRQTTSPENAVRFQHAFGDIDVRALLPQIKVPTLVLHARNDQRISLNQGRELAAGIPNARFVPLDSKNHIILGHEPAWRVCFDEIDQFLAEHDI